MNGVDGRKGCVDGRKECVDASMDVNDAWMDVKDASMFDHCRVVVWWNIRSLK